MKKIVFAIITLILVSACVSSSKYEEMESSLNKKIREKEYAISKLEDEVSSLRSKIGDIESDVENALFELQRAKSWAIMEDPFMAQMNINNAIFTLEAIDF